jgi:hypothetical protein
MRMSDTPRDPQRRTNGPIERVLLMALGAGLAIFGVYIAVWVLAIFVGQIRTGAWASTPGTLVTVQRTKPAVSTGSFELILSYEYVVNSQRFVGSSLRYNDNVLRRSGTAKRYPPLSVGPCTVYYDPSNPGDSVLRPGFDNFDISLGFIPVGLALLAVGAFLVSVPVRDLVRVYRRRRLMT